MMQRTQRQMQLIDCHNYQSLKNSADFNQFTQVNRELFIVEGESAASSVAALCNRNFQAILPLQGKPINAFKATEKKVNESALHIQLANALGLEYPTGISPSELDNLKFGNIFLLLDPDADGIHISALVLMYMKRWLPQLIVHQKIHLLRAPMFSVRSRQSHGTQHTEYAFLPQQLTQIKQLIHDKGGIVLSTERYQSVGSIPPAILQSYCIDPATRMAEPVTDAHLEMMINMFG